MSTPGQAKFPEPEADPYPYLDEAAKKKMATAHSDLLRKFTELTFDEWRQGWWLESQRPATEKSL